MYCTHTSLAHHLSHDILLQLTIGTAPVMYGLKTEPLSHETPQGLSEVGDFLETELVLYLLHFLKVSQFDWDNWGTW